MRKKISNYSLTGFSLFYYYCKTSLGEDSQPISILMCKKSSILMAFNSIAKSNQTFIMRYYYADCVITQKRVTSGGAHLRSLAPGQHSSEETSQRWRVIGNTVLDLADQGNKPAITSTDSNVFTTDIFNHLAQKAQVDFEEILQPCSEVQGNF